VQVLGLAWPVLVEQLLGTAVGLVNTYIVGHLGAGAIAAVGLSTQIRALLMALFSAVGVGSTALVARHVGAQEPEEAAHIAGQSLLLSMVVGLCAALPCLLLARPLLRALGATDQVVGLGRSYLFALGTTMPLMALLFIGDAVVRGTGDTRTPMVVMSLVNVVNAGVSASLVYGPGPLPELGVLGAAIGSATSAAVGGLAVAFVLLRGRSRTGLRIVLRTLRFDPQRTWRLLRIGVPAGVEQLVMRVAQLALATIVTRLGTAAYAGHQLGIQLLSVAFMPGFAFSVASTALVGQELGRQAGRRAEACARAASWMALGIMCTIGLVVFLLARPLLQLFTSDPAVITQGLYAMRGCALIQPPLAYYFVLAGALRGAGDTRFTLLVQGLCIWVLRLPLALGLGVLLGLGLVGVWAGMILDMTGRALLLGLRFRSGAWKRLSI
jgi:putative MATE family efflux protein